MTTEDILVGLKGIIKEKFNNPVRTILRIETAGNYIDVFIDIGYSTPSISIRVYDDRVIVVHRTSVFADVSIYDPKAFPSEILNAVGYWIQIIKPNTC